MPQSVNLSYKGIKCATDADLHNPGQARISSGERITLSNGGSLQVVSITPATVLYKLFRPVDGEPVSDRCVRTIDMNCSGNARDIPMFVSFQPNFGYGDWACILKSLRPLRMMVLNPSNLKQFVAFLIASNAPSSLTALAADILHSDTVKIPDAWTEEPTLSLTRPTGWLSDAEHALQADVGEFFMNDHLVPGALKKPVHIRSSAMQIDTIFFGAIRSYIKQLGLDGIWSPSKPGSSGYWGEARTLKKGPGWHPDWDREPSINQRGQYYRGVFPEEAVIYDCSSVQLVAQVPLRAVQSTVDNVCRLFDELKADSQQVKVVPYLRESCCDPDRILQFVQIAPTAAIRDQLIALHKLLTQPNVTLPTQTAGHRSSSRTSRRKKQYKSRAKFRASRKGPARKLPRRKR